MLAYRNTARTIESLPQRVAQLLKEGKDLKKLKLPGIGKSMAEHVEEIIKTGTLQSLKHRAREIGVKIAINTDAHNTEQLHFMRYGID